MLSPVRHVSSPCSHVQLPGTSVASTGCPSASMLTNVVPLVWVTMTTGTSRVYSGWVVFGLYGVVYMGRIQWMKPHHKKQPWKHHIPSSPLITTTPLSPCTLYTTNPTAPAAAAWRVLSAKEQCPLMASTTGAPPLPTVPPVGVLSASRVLGVWPSGDAVYGDGSSRGPHASSGLASTRGPRTWQRMAAPSDAAAPHSCCCAALDDESCDTAVGSASSMSSYSSSSSSLLAATWRNDWCAHC